LISWKHSFNRLNEEYEMAKKKKQALDNLFEKGRISLSTHDSFNNELAIAITEIEKQQQDLLQKMQMKTDELQSQIRTLEMLLANYEIQHVAGEIDDNTYELEINLLTSGLATAQHELNNIKEAANQLCAPTAPAPAAEPAATPQVEVAPAPCTENVEVAVEAVPAEVTVAPPAPEPCIQEPIPEPIPEPTPEPVAAPEPIAAPVVEAAVVEPPAPVEEAKVEAVAEPVIEEPAPAPAAAVEETIVEQPAVEAAPEPIIEEPVPTPEAAVIEQPAEVVVEAEKVETAPEPIIEEAAAVVEEAVVEEAAPVVEAEVVQPEIVDAQVPPIVEEIMTANPSKAPVAAQIEAAAETVPEVSAETQPISTTTSAKEVLPVIESPTDSSEDKEA
jgi:hypothetical protein